MNNMKVDVVQIFVDGVPVISANGKCNIFFSCGHNNRYYLRGHQVVKVGDTGFCGKCINEKFNEDNKGAEENVYSGDGNIRIGRGNSSDDRELFGYVIKEKTKAIDLISDILDRGREATVTKKDFDYIVRELKSRYEL